MTALSFSLRHPNRVRRLVSISSGSKSQPYSIALRSLQREMIRSDPIWDNGNYKIGSEGPISGMRLARKLGMISYRSAAEWKIRFGRERASSASILKSKAIWRHRQIDSPEPSTLIVICISLERWTYSMRVIMVAR